MSPLALIELPGLVLLGGLCLWLFATQHARRRRHQAETASLTRALTLGQERLRAVNTASLQRMFDLDLSTGMVTMDPPEAAGSQADDTDALSAWFDRIHPDDRASLLAGFRDHKSGRLDVFTADYRHAAGGGAWRWMQTTSRVLARSASGVPVRVIGTHTDITDRKLAELRAQRLASLYAALNDCSDAAMRARTEDELFGLVCDAVIAHGATTMAWIGRVDAASSRVVPAVWRGNGSEYMRGLTVSIDPADPYGQGPAGRALRSGGPVWVDDFQTSALTAVWHERARACGWQSVAGLPLECGGRAVSVLVVYGTATDSFDADTRGMLVEFAHKVSFGLDRLAFEARREAVELAHRASQARYENLFKLAPMAVFVFRDERIVMANDACVRLFGVDTPDEIVGQSPVAFFDSAEHDDIRQKIRTVLATGQPVPAHPRRLLPRGGGVRHLEVSAAAYDEGGMRSLHVALVDVTDRFEATQHAEATGVRYRALFESMLNGVAYCRMEYDGDRPVDFVYLAVNPAFTTLTGLANVEGRRVTEVIPGVAEQDPELFAAYGRVARSGVPETFERYLRSLDMWFSVAAYSPEPDHFVAVFDVITARKRAEAALHASLAEKEALLREVHHRVKNNLQVISSLLRLEAGRSGQPATVSVLDDMQHRILSMALLHETLYRSPASGDIDLGAYLSALVHQLFRLLTTADATGLTVDMAPAPVSMEQAIPCGLIVNELVSNALKHGRPAQGRGAVAVSLHPMDNGAMRLEVRDSGRGLPADVDDRRRHTLGLQLISDLARQLQGTAAWRTDDGTVATVIFTPKRAHAVR